MDQDFEKAKTIVEGALRKLGLDVAASRVPAESGATRISWTFKRGSASVLVTAGLHPQGGAHLRVVSPVVRVPTAPDRRSSLLTRLLELNAAGLANAAFGLIGDLVVAVCERPATGLDTDAVEKTLRHLAAVADTYDDRLKKDFGATDA